MATYFQYSWATVHGVAKSQTQLSDWHFFKFGKNGLAFQKMSLWWIKIEYVYRGSGEGNGTPLQHFCLENPMDGGAWWAAVHGVAKSLDTTERLHFHFSLSCIGEGNGNPLQRSCLKNPRDGGAWWAAVYGVTQSWTWLKWLSSSSCVTRLKSNGGSVLSVLYGHEKFVE